MSKVVASIGTSWVKYATLDFESPNRMLQKLLTIPAPIGDVRYVRVTGGGVVANLDKLAPWNAGC